MKRRLAWLLTGLLTPAAAAAITTQSFVIETSDAFEKGKLEGTAVHSDGRVTRSISTKRIAVEGAALAYTSAVGPDKAIYVGTGSQGSIYRVDDKAAKLFAHTDAPLVSALVWVGDTLYAGTLEQGKVLAITRQGAVKPFAALPGANHVWALSYDAPRATLYAATGPEGKLFAIDKSGAARVVHDDEAEHLLSLAVDAEGRLYTGTSSGARLVRIAAGRASVLYDAPGQEITTLALGPGYVAIASNEFDNPSATGDLKEGGGRGKRTKAGRGKLFTVTYDGAVEELYRSESAHITALEVDAARGHVYAGLGVEGRVVRGGSGQQATVWADADERQVVALHLAGDVPHFVSSDGVAVYRVTDKGAPAVWTSAVQDAKVPARFGELQFRKSGDIRFATRTGNTEVPDGSWSAWSSETSQPGPIHSPGARFLQLRATLQGEAELYAVHAYYLPQNQAAYVRNVRATPERSGGNKGTVSVSWDVDNPDGDRLRYRVFFLREGAKAGLPITREEEVLDRSELKWETASVPDGFYRVRVEASDELATPPPFVKRSSAHSEPVLIDNHGPELLTLRLQGSHLTGEAADSLGPIAQLELSLDSGPFLPISSVDGLLDQPRERFELDLSKLPGKPRIVTVRATDAGGNPRTAALEIPAR